MRPCHAPRGRVGVRVAPLRALPLRRLFLLWLLTASALALAAGLLRAQPQGGLRPAAEAACMLPIPPQAVVVSSARNVDETWSREPKTYWVCAGASLTVNRGDGNIYYVESLGRLRLSGGKHRVFLKANASLIMDWGAEVSVVRDPSASVKDESITSEPEIKDCPGLSFNYFDSPEGGCPGVVRRPPPPPPQPRPTPTERPVPWPDTPPADPLPTAPGDYTEGYLAMVVPISPAARAITFPRSELANARHYWVCANGRLQLSGSNNVVFLEPGATLQLRGDNNLVYVKYGAHVQFAGGNDNLVLAEQGSDVPQGNWGGDQWSWGGGWYGPQGLRKRDQLRGPAATRMPPVRTPAPRPQVPPGTPGAQLRGNMDKDKPEEQRPADPAPGDYQPPAPTEPPRQTWPPRPGQDQERLTVGAIGPPYDMPARLRLEWLAYLEFDLRAAGFTRCR